MQWYLIQTKPNKHLIASENLRRQGFDIFLPLILKTSRKAGKFVKETIPLFPSYLFMGTNSEKISWKSINATRGVSKAVTMDNIYRAINNEIIEELKYRCDTKGIFKNGLNIISGDHAKIDIGPFADFVCEVQKISDDRRVWVLIEILRQKTLAKVALDNLSKIH